MCRCEQYLRSSLFIVCCLLCNFALYKFMLLWNVCIMWLLRRNMILDFFFNFYDWGCSKISCKSLWNIHSLSFTWKISLGVWSFCWAFRVMKHTELLLSHVKTSQIYLTHRRTFFDGFKKTSRFRNHSRNVEPEKRIWLNRLHKKFLFFVFETFLSFNTTIFGADIFADEFISCNFFEFELIHFHHQFFETPVIALIQFVNLVHINSGKTQLKYKNTEAKKRI